jgi:hypothetical protein
VNKWQLVKQIQFTLRARTWEGTGSVVFAPESVIATAGPVEEALADRCVPIAVIKPMGGEDDDDEPGIVRQSIVVRIGTSGEDQLGEASLMGANRSGTSTSDGRGVLEVEEELLATLKEMSKINGITVVSRGASATVAEIDKNLRHVTWVEHAFDAWITTDRYYPPPRLLEAAVPGGGAVNLTWSLPASRFDRCSLVLRRAAGATAPATIADGTGVAVGALDTSKNDVPGAGVWSYSLFMGYDEVNSPVSTPQRYSAAATVTATAT